MHVVCLILRKAKYREIYCLARGESLVNRQPIFLLSKGDLIVVIEVLRQVADARTHSVWFRNVFEKGQRGCAEAPRINDVWNPVILELLRVIRVRAKRVIDIIRDDRAVSVGR